MNMRNAPMTMPEKPSLLGEPYPDLLPVFGFDIAYGANMIFIVFLRWLFKESFTGLEWNLNDDDSKIIICDKYSTYAKSVHKKPRIITDRGNITWDNISINKQGGSGSKEVPVYKDGIGLVYTTDPAYGGRPGLFSEFGSKNYPGANTMIDTVSGQLAINCYAEEGLLAQRMASFVFVAIRTFRKKLQEMGFHSVDSAALGRESPEFATSNFRLVGVPVVVKFTMFVTVEMTTVAEAIEATEACAFEKLRIGVMVSPNMAECYHAAQAAQDDPPAEP